MNDRAIHMRIQFLGIDRHNTRERLLERKKGGAPADELQAIERELLVLTGRINECQDWLKVQSANPAYGEAVWKDGKKVPKLPVFKSAEEREKALNGLNPGVFLNINAEERLAAREWRGQANADAAVTMMDGNSPYSTEVAEGVSPQVRGDVQQHAGGGEPGAVRPAGDEPGGREPDGGEPAGG